MFKRFLQLEWKAFLRAASFGQSIGLKIFLGFLAIYILGSFLVFGIALYPVLKEFFPDQVPMKVANNFIAIWFVMEIVYRFTLQSLPVMDVKPMMINNINRKTIIHFVLIKSIFSFYNLIATVIFIPFGIFCIVQGDYSAIQILAWILAMFSMVLIANYTNFLIKKKFAENLKAFLPYAIIVLVLVGLEYFEIFKISEFIGGIFNFLLEHPYLAVVPVLIVLVLYFWNFKYLRNNFYLDASLKGKSTKIEATDLTWTRKFGSIAPFLQNDLKLIWRNKRPKATVWVSLLFVAYGLFFYPNPTYLNIPAFLVFVGIFITGVFVINFGQFIPAWDSGYYSMMMSQNIPLKQYLASKAGLMYFSVVVMAIISSPYIYFGKDILYLNLACAVYNAGVNIPLILYAGSFNKKRIDLEKSPFMNYQGTGATQWILGFPLLLIPIGVWYIVYAIFDKDIATLSLAIIGLVCLLLRNYFMTLIVEGYRKRKYIMITGFKQQES